MTWTQFIGTVLVSGSLSFASAMMTLSLRDLYRERAGLVGRTTPKEFVTHVCWFFILFSGLLVGWRLMAP